MLTPQLVVGRGNGTPALLKVGVGYLDDDLHYEMLGRSAPYAPAGSGGECAFFSIYLITKTFDTDVALFVTPIIDGVAMPTQRVDILGVALSKGEQRVTEIGLSKAYSPAGVEELRYAPRGTWISVQIETKILTGAGVAAKQIVDGVECEFEIVRETKEVGTT